MAQPLALDPSLHDRTQRRSILVLVLCVIAVISITRVLQVTRPFGDNDGSRFLTIRALVEQGTFHIGERWERPDGRYEDRGLLFEQGKRGSIDVVLNPNPVWTDPEAKPHEVSQRKQYYSSKPPLLPVLVAGEYYLLRNGFHLEWETHRPLILRILLLTFNVFPWLFVLGGWMLLLERFTDDLWVQVYWLSAAGLGTLIFSFQTTLNNHTVAAWSLGLVIYLFLKADAPGLGHCFWIGFWSGFTMANELPAASFAALMGLYILWKHGWLSAVFYGCGCVIPLVAEAGLIKASLGTWQPAYAKFGTEWYNFPGAYWANPQEIDALQQPWPIYLFHLTFGHHGWYSLTPLFLIGWFGDKSPFAAQPKTWQALAVIGGIVSLVVLGFYVYKTNNYGGWTCGPRWLIWLIPFALWSLLPGLRVFSSSRSGRMILMIVLVLSLFSSLYPGINPWQHPWLFQLARLWGWIDY